MAKQQLGARIDETLTRRIEALIPAMSGVIIANKSDVVIAALNRGLPPLEKEFGVTYVPEGSKAPKAKRGRPKKAKADAPAETETAES